MPYYKLTVRVTKSAQHYHGEIKDRQMTNKKLKATAGVTGSTLKKQADEVDLAEQEWATDVPEKLAQVYALSARIIQVASLLEWSYKLESESRGLSKGEMQVLDALRRLGPPYEASASQLKEHFLLSYAGIGKRINRLEELGYVSRNRRMNDRRSQDIGLTSAGLDLLHNSEKSSLAPHTPVLMQFSSRELGSLSRLLKKLQTSLELAKAGKD